MGGGPGAVGALTHFHCPTLAAVSHPLAPPLAGSATGRSPRAPEGGAPEAVGAPIHFQSLPSKFNASISNSSNSNSLKINYSNSSVFNATGPCPGAPAGLAPEAVGAQSTSRVQPWQQFLPPWPHLWLVTPLGPALGPLMGQPLRLWGPLSTTKVQPWQQFLLPWPQHWLARPSTSRVQPWQQLPLS